MYQIAYIGRWETLPETAAAICDHDTSKLEALLQGDLNLMGLLRRGFPRFKGLYQVVGQIVALLVRLI